MQDKATILGNNWIDVTGEYRQTVTGVIHAKKRIKKEKVALAVFDGIKNWVPIELCSKKDGKSYLFKNLGKDIVYLPIAWEDKKYVTIDFPFYFDKNNHQISLKPAGKIKKAILERNTSQGSNH